MLKNEQELLEGLTIHKMPECQLWHTFKKRVNDTMRQVEINHEPVELYKLLKFESMVLSGGEAKFVISEGQVLVNGEVETRKRKKIVSGDIIEFANEKIIVNFDKNDSTHTEGQPKT